MTNDASHGPRCADSRGFAVVAVLIVLTLMLTLGITYMQHTALGPKSSAAHRDVLQSAEDGSSAMAFVQREIGSGEMPNSLAVPGEQRPTTTGTASLGLGHVRVDATSLDSDNLGDTLVLESVRIPALGDLGVASPDQLPALSQDFVKALLDDESVARVYVDSDTTFTDIEIDGVIVLAPAVRLTLDGVIVRGAIVSDAALSGPPVGAYDPSLAPDVYVAGSFRIESTDAIPGVAIVIPDGRVITAYGIDESFQIEGALVAHTVIMDGRGSVAGSVAYVELELGAQVERPGYGREPLLVPDVLEPGAAWEQSALAFVPRSQSAKELQAVTDFWKSKDK